MKQLWHTSYTLIPTESNYTIDWIEQQLAREDFKEAQAVIDKLLNTNPKPHKE